VKEIKEDKCYSYSQNHTKDVTSVLIGEGMREKDY
jgi:hypothetical protein